MDKLPTARAQRHAPRSLIGLAAAVLLAAGGAGAASGPSQGNLGTFKTMSFSEIKTELCKSTHSTRVTDLDKAAPAKGFLKLSNWTSGGSHNLILKDSVAAIKHFETFVIELFKLVQGSSLALAKRDVAGLGSATTLFSRCQFFHGHMEAKGSSTKMLFHTLEYPKADPKCFNNRVDLATLHVNGAALDFGPADAKNAKYRTAHNVAYDMATNTFEHATSGFDGNTGTVLYSAATIDFNYFPEDGNIKDEYKNRLIVKVTCP